MAGSGDELGALALQLDDTRAELIEEHKRAQAKAQQDFDTLWTLLTHPPEDAAVPLLEEVITLLTPRSPRRPWWHRCCWPAACVLTGLVGYGLAWWMWSATGTVRTWAQLGQRLDAVVVEQYLGLSTPAQQAISTLYRQLGIATPGDRKGKRS